MAAKNNRNPIYPKSICGNCGVEFRGTTRLCAPCDVAEQIKMRKAAEPTFDANPYAYALKYGKQAVIEALRSRWCDQPAGRMNDG